MNDPPSVRLKIFQVHLQHGTQLLIHSQHGAQLREHPRPENFFFNFNFFLQQQALILNFSHVLQHGAQTWLGSSPTPAIILLPTVILILPFSSKLQL